MGNIRVRVSQGGGTEGGLTALGSGPVGLGLTSDDGTPIPAGIGLALSVNGRSVGSSTTPTATSVSEGFSYPFSGNAVDLSYNVVVSNVPAGTTFSNLSSTVSGTSLSEEVAMNKTAAGTPAPREAGRSLSIFQRIWSFLLRLFGIKTA